jgi:pimeloyl-ACP methyl ester carboxylesterase
MIHGFGGGAGVFLRMAPLLTSHYEVICIDLLGMGASGRPKYDIWECQPAIDWFLDSLKSYFEKRNLNDFVLLGHSFGGYMAAEYALQYPD